jgi:hypothetical protein
MRRDAQRRFGAVLLAEGALFDPAKGFVVLQKHRPLCETPPDDH